MSERPGPDRKILERRRGWLDLRHSDLVVDSVVGVINRHQLEWLLFYALILAAAAAFVWVVWLA